MIQFAKEPLTDALWDEAMPLLQAHWKEVAAFQDIPLNPDRALYAASEEAGILRVFTARDIDLDKVTRRFVPAFDQEIAALAPNLEIRDVIYGYPLVGYALYFVRPAPHYQSSVQAVQDVLYLARDHRGRTALKFIAWCDEQLQAEGCQCVYQHIKTVLPNAHRALKHLGYVEVDTIYAKRLDARESKQVDAGAEMGDDWRDQAQHDYDTARFVGQKP